VKPATAAIDGHFEVLGIEFFDLIYSLESSKAKMTG
jgi:hypothetical protein